jgi:GNAT superfamily N-acetyltransferase
VVGEIQIRRAGTRDTPPLVSLWTELVEHHHRLDPDYPMLPGLERLLQREVERGLRLESCEIWIAEFEGRACGFVFAEVENGRDAPTTGATTAWIHELFVAEEARGRGVGRALVGRAERFFESCGRPRTAVRVETGNREALAFWQHLGFVERARILERRATGPGVAGEEGDSGRGGHADTTSARTRD